MASSDQENTNSAQGDPICLNCTKAKENNVRHVASACPKLREGDTTTFRLEYPNTSPHIITLNATLLSSMPPLEAQTRFPGDSRDENGNYVVKEIDPRHMKTVFAFLNQPVPRFADVLFTNIDHGINLRKVMATLDSITASEALTENVWGMDWVKRKLDQRYPEKGLVKALFGGKSKMRNPEGFPNSPTANDNRKVDVAACMLGNLLLYVMLLVLSHERKLKPVPLKSGTTKVHNCTVYEDFEDWKAKQRSKQHGSKPKAPRRGRRDDFQALDATQRQKLFNALDYVESHTRMFKLRVREGAKWFWEDVEVGRSARQMSVVKNLKGIFDDGGDGKKGKGNWKKDVDGARGKSRRLAVVVDGTGIDGVGKKRQEQKDEKGKGKGKTNAEVRDAEGEHATSAMVVDVKGKGKENIDG